MACLSLCAPCHLRSIATTGTSPPARTERKLLKGILSCPCFVLFREGTHQLSSQVPLGNDMESGIISSYQLISVKYNLVSPRIPSPEGHYRFRPTCAHLAETPRLLAMSPGFFAMLYSSLPAVKRNHSQMATPAVQTWSICFTKWGKPETSTDFGLMTCSERE